jgi:hypothetical protein
VIDLPRRAPPGRRSCRRRDRAPLRLPFRRLVEGVDDRAIHVAALVARLDKG